MSAYEPSRGVLSVPAGGKVRMTRSYGNCYAGGVYDVVWVTGLENIILADPETRERHKVPWWAVQAI